MIGESLRTISPAFSGLEETSALPLFSISTILIKAISSDILLSFFDVINISHKTNDGKDSVFIGRKTMKKSDNEKPTHRKAETDGNFPIQLMSLGGGVFRVRWGTGPLG